VTRRVNFQNPNAALAGSDIASNLIFEREDWTSFRTIEGLQQKAGVSKDKLTRLVMKELTDNSLDAGGAVDVGTLPKGGYFVEDDGPGIDGSPEDIARLFSIRRPMISTKLLRLPQRGALGNGLRVVAGAVLASEGSLTVITRDRQIVLCPERDGSTTVVKHSAVKYPRGTRIEIRFGPALRCDANTLDWAKLARHFAGHGTSYAGRSSPWWYDVPHFHELLSASGDRPVRELIAQLDGCTGGKAGEIVAAARLGRVLCKDITRQQAERLLSATQDHVKPVTPQRLGAVGAGVLPDYAYACVRGEHESIPFVVEAWAITPDDFDETALTVFVNRTPVTGDIEATRDKRDIDAFGCGLSHTVATAPKEAQFAICLNITTPYMPITSDGKAPDLEPFLSTISAAITKVVRKAHRPNAGHGISQKDIVLEHLDAAIAHVSGGHRFNQRQLLYALRPIVKTELNADLTTDNFSAIITDYEQEHGEIPLMYREPRGSIYHPHRGETITLGTLMVEQYERPVWTYNKIIYIEKEGFSEALKEARWSERHDCMLMSSKGYTTRAARDLVDKLAEHDEPVTIFLVTDADAYGTMIYQTFQEATKARGARKIRIVHLGLHPWEAIADGLPSEEVKPGDRRKPVAQYVLDRDDTAPDGDTWEEWLQTHRIELNAMTTPDFIRWLDRKMAEHGGGKLIPPNEVLEVELATRIEQKVRAIIRERILREAGFERQVEDTITAIKKPSAAILTKGIKALFKTEPDREWRDHIEAVAANKAKA
jgi:hypothetical protein